jgi:N-methylhydantoinase A
MTLHPDLAAAAVDRLAHDLGVDRITVARGILSVVQTNMLGAIRIVSVRKGYDPRAYTMVAFGGAGPLHAAALARDLGIRQVLVPPAPGHLCALGLLVEPRRLDLVRTRVGLLDAAFAADVARLFDELEAEARAWLEREGVTSARRRITRAFDMRYLGQNFELRVPEPAERGDVEALRRAFLREHERVYGYAADDEPVQVVNVRLTALGDPEPLDLPAVAAAPKPDPGAARVGERPVWFDETGAFTPTPVYRREKLLAGHTIPGPAIVEQMDSTTVVLPGQSATVDTHGNLLIRTDGDASPSRARA